MDRLLDALRSPASDAGADAPEEILLAMLLAFVVGHLVAWVYALTHAGISYSRGYTQSLVVLTIVTTVVMLTIGSSFITAFGLMGALAIIRFRNVLKDTRDTVFVFFALVAGMAIGSQRYLVAVGGTVFFLLVILYLRLTEFGSRGSYDGHLTCWFGMGARAPVAGVIRRYCSGSHQISVRESGSSNVAEHVFRIRLRDHRRHSDLVQELRGVAGVEDVSLVLREELTEL
jgi:uncharacterized membrane protein YhiD involved in acid resistance